MIVKQIIGSGMTGAIRYVMGEGVEREQVRVGENVIHKTIGRKPPAANENESRVAWMSAQGFGAWQPQSRADVDLMRKIMEFSALPENQKYKTKICREDCLHLVLSWRVGETPNKEEMEKAAREALGVLGMEKARALFIAHDDTKHAHLHVIASRIDPETGRAYRDFHQSKKALQKWALEWERAHGNVQCLNREKRSQLADAIAKRDVNVIIDLMTQRKATFTENELDRALRRELDFTRAGMLKQEILSSSSLVQLYDRKLKAELPRFTTEKVRKAELSALDSAATLAASKSHGIEAAHKAAILEQFPTMNAEQRAAFERATGPEGLSIIVGKAGTGKSYTMRAIRQAYEAEGYRVLGLAPTGVVVEDMKRDGFKDARTLHSALFALKNGRDSWNRETLLMVDEAAMTGSPIAAELLRYAEEAGAKIIPVGDGGQLASIERGGLFSEFYDRHGAAELTQVLRQRDAEHKTAAEMLARGEFKDALDIFEKGGCLHWENHQEEARAALVEKWKRDSEADPVKSRFIFAFTNEDVRKLNEEIRAVRRERGELGEDHQFKTKDGIISVAEGDRIIFTTTNRKAGVINGVMGEVESIEEKFITIRPDNDRTKTITFCADTIDGFRHAYAGTIHKGQGRTFDDAYLYFSAHWKDAASYVALTRHRFNVSLFASYEVAENTADLARLMARHDDNRASVAFATAEDLALERQQQRQQYDRAAAQVTEPTLAPHHPPPPPPDKQPKPEVTPPAPERRPDSVIPRDRTPHATHGEDAHQVEQAADPRGDQQRKVEVSPVVSFLEQVKAAVSPVVSFWEQVKAAQNAEAGWLAKVEAERKAAVQNAEAGWLAKIEADREAVVQNAEVGFLPKIEADRQAKVEAERKAAAQKAEADRQAKIEAERRAAAQRAEAERQAKVEAERKAAAQKAEADRQAKIEAERRAAAQKAEADRLAKVEAERKAAAQKAEAERQAKIEAERKAAAQKAEADRLAKIEADRKTAAQKAEAERQAKVEAERKAAAQKSEPTKAPVKAAPVMSSEEQRRAAALRDWQSQFQPTPTFAPEWIGAKTAQAAPMSSKADSLNAAKEVASVAAAPVLKAAESLAGAIIDILSPTPPPTPEQIKAMNKASAEQAEAARKAAALREWQEQKRQEAIENELDRHYGRERKR